MPILSKSLAILLLGAALVACNQGGSSSNAVATVNGMPITEDMVRAYVRSQANGEEPQLTDMQRQQVIKTLVNMQLLAQAAGKDGLDKKPEVNADMTMSQTGILAQAELVQYLKDHQPTEAQLQSAYQDQLKSADTHEYKARHILVNDEGQAKDIIAQLGKGASFASLAAKYSQDPGSKGKGGDLGDWFPASSMVPEFGGVLAGLKKGEYTKEPVHTQYGWHVIQLEDVRSVPAPTFEDMHDKLAEQLQHKSVNDYLDGLRKSAKVVMNTPAPAAASAKPAVPAKP
jgi:peptidyl-prolyl cis-trans isomerase C